MDTNGLKSRRSVTLIELVMVIIIVGVLAGASSMYIKETVDLWRFLSYRNEVVAQGRMSLMRMEREIRQVKDSYSVIIAGASQFQFNDIDSVNIDYQRSGNNLMRNSNILATGVEYLNFTYYDNNNSVLATPIVSPSKTDIHRLDIEFRIVSGTQVKTLKSQVYPRNLGN